MARVALDVGDSIDHSSVRCEGARQRCLLRRQIGIDLNLLREQYFYMNSSESNLITGKIGSLILGSSASESGYSFHSAKAQPSLGVLVAA